MRSALRLTIPLTLVLVSCVCVSLRSQPSLDPDTGYIPRPNSRPILIVNGNIGVTSDGKTAYLSYEQLKSFPQHSTQIQKPWFDDIRVQSGPLLREVLEFLQAEGEIIVGVAFNDYSTTLPISDTYEIPVILAIDLGNQPMAVRDMGPVFVTYPLISDPQLRKELYYSRSIWQVKQLTIE
ncbi:MAG: hypothetical protein AAGB06_02940 [Verrucomicrobiota bacterium]